MMGDKNSVRTRFEQSCPGIYIMKCLCHSLHLCASNACSELPAECEKLPHLKEIQSILALKAHKILRPAQTRWLSIRAVVERLLEQWDGLFLYFNNDQIATEENKSDVARILRCLQNPTMKLYYHFLLWSLPKFTDLNKLFQSEKPLITAVHKKMSLTYLDLLKTFMDDKSYQYNYINMTSLKDINPSNEAKFKNIHNIYVGIEAFNYFNKPESTKPPLLEEKINFLTNLINPREAMNKKTVMTMPSL
ncbi:GSCOCG00012450001-RA-CDS [Cotesia congregata]|nr:GSCOCG00012450001-RA-CDS [Cotesia congregata]